MAEMEKSGDDYQTAAKGFFFFFFVTDVNIFQADCLSSEGCVKKQNKYIKNIYIAILPKETK